VTLTVNGSLRQALEPVTVADLLATEQEPAQHVVVEVNGRYVPRTAYADHVLSEGDRVEIILPAFGG
jgi:thiamine biosynthesis protein ThiS